MNLLKWAWVIFRLRRRFYGWDRARLERHQEKRVAAILDHARRLSRYCSARLTPGCGLEDVPVIDKSVMMANFNAINTAGLDRDTLVAFEIAQERAGGMDPFAGG